MGRQLETHLIAAMIVDPRQIEWFARYIHPEYFMERGPRVIYQILLDLAKTERVELIDVMKVMTEMDRIREQWGNVDRTSADPDPLSHIIEMAEELRWQEAHKDKRNANCNHQ